MKKTVYLWSIVCVAALMLNACRSKQAVLQGEAAISPVPESAPTTQPAHFRHLYPAYPFTLKARPVYPAAPNYYEAAYRQLQSMLSGETPADFEKAVFITENAYYHNRLRFDDFQKVLNWHTARIEWLIQANDKSQEMDFSTIRIPGEKLDYRKLRYTGQEQRELYRKALTNWAIFTYLTDTTHFGNQAHYPYTYQVNDPFGMHNWKNAQVLHLLSADQDGNCFALAALFKIFANRLNSGACICTAPQHIYIQHRDAKGSFYNVELATGTFPSDGTLQTLTYTHREAILSGISLRRLDNAGQDIALCLVNLAKGYAHQYRDNSGDFILQCAGLALQYDSLNLNAMLLREEALETRIVKYAAEKGITDIRQIAADTTMATVYARLQQQVLQLYDLGYRPMPYEMQQTVLAALQGNKQPPVMKNHTPKPFTGIRVPARDSRYATLSGGVYEEVHAPKRFEQYGRFILDAQKRTLVQLTAENNLEPLIDPVVFAWSVDPMAGERTAWTPYNAFRDNPVLNIDPTGALDYEYDKDGNKISDLGGDKINFYHQANGDTKVEDMETGATNIIFGGEALIRGYTKREPNVNWFQVFNEWYTGTGPTKSMFADFENSDQGPFKSLYSPFSSYTGLAREASINLSDLKGTVTLEYLQANPQAAQDMWEQMWGRSNVSWYKLGNKTLFFMNDSKSMTSFVYRLAPNWERSTLQPKGNTYQTYIWIESKEDVQHKNDLRMQIIHQEFQRILRESRSLRGPKF